MLFTTMRPPPRSAVHAVSIVWSVAPPPMKIASGLGRPCSTSGCRAFDDRQIGHTERRCVAGDSCCAGRVALDGDRAVRRMGQHPFNAHGAGSGTDIPKQFALPRRQRRKCHGADVLLGQLTVMLEPCVGQSRGQRNDARPWRRCQFDRDEVQRVDVLEGEFTRLRASADALVGRPLLRRR